MRKYTVVVEWADSGDTEDADEIAIYADSPQAAIAKAKAKWRITIGAAWPNCQLVKAWILAPKRAAAYG